MIIRPSGRFTLLFITLFELLKKNLRDGQQFRGLDLLKKTHKSFLHPICLCFMCHEFQCKARICLRAKGGKKKQIFKAISLSKDSFHCILEV